MLIEELKAKARKAAFTARKEAKSPANDAAIAQCLAAVLAAHQGKVLAGYMPIRTEADPRPVMAQMSAASPVCVPVIVGESLPLSFRQWQPGCVMEPGPFGAQVPAAGDWLVPQVLIVPLVAFDRRGGRLGYGGGFYDRTLEKLRAGGEVAAYGLAFAAQEMSDLPLEPTDQALDGIVTEQGLIAPRDAKA